MDINYFVTDTGKELPEVNTFLSKLEAILFPKNLRLSPDKDIDHWLDKFNNFLPSAQTWWCIRTLKLRPVQELINTYLEGGVKVYSYVAIRADADYREGFDSMHQNLVVKFSK